MPKLVQMLLWLWFKKIAYALCIQTTHLDSAFVSNERARLENDKGPGLSRGVAKSWGKVAVEITDMESPSPEPSPHKSKLIAK